MHHRYAILLLCLVSVTPIRSQSPTTDIARSPDWARKAIWYQIFPERFRNGDRRNDPKVPDLAGAWPHEVPAEWNISPWTSDWFRLQPWEISDHKGFYYHAQLRRYGGDLQGVIDKLDYLNKLGINAIYFNPLFQSPSLHKYDASMYHHIDKNFGPDPDGDQKIWAEENPADPSTWKWTSADTLFLRLVREAHRRGMHVILDGVFNHVGRTFWAFRDVLKNQQRSAYKDWFTILGWDDPSTPEDEFKYKGWENVWELPELRKDSNTIAAGPREHIHAVVRRWMDPNGDGDPSDGIDGWRLDVADKVPLGFWREFRTWVRSINPEAYITGEVWWQDWKNDVMYNAAPWLGGDAFDAVMNYRWAQETCHFFIDRKNKIPPSEFDRRLDALRRDYLKERDAVLMNLMDSHDTDRLLSHIVNPDLTYDHRVGTADNRRYNIRKPRAREFAIQKLIVAFQMTYIGAPMIYYGDEVGMWGGDDPDDRKPMLWSDMVYEDESSHPFGQQRPDDKNVADTELYDYYAKMIHLRRDHPALTGDSLQTLLTDDRNDVYAYLRVSTGERILVGLNNADAARTVRIRIPSGTSVEEWSDLLTGAKFTPRHGILTAKIPKKSFRILQAVN